MKKSVIVIAIFFSNLICSAQKINPTTLEEYNYCSVGYKIQLQTKMEMKSGYNLQDYNSCEESERKVEFKGLFRNNEKNPCAIIMIYTKVRGAPDYFCIPTKDANPELWNKFYKSLEGDAVNGQPQLQFYCKCIAQLVMQITSN